MSDQLQQGLAFAACVLAFGVGFALIIAASALHNYLSGRSERPAQPLRPLPRIEPREPLPTWTYKKTTTTKPKDGKEAAP
jgi:hypothetical protein